MKDINHPVNVGAPKATVNSLPTMVTLWRDGATIAVPEESVEALSKDGWLTNSPTDIKALVHEISLYASQVSNTVANFVEEVKRTGHIDAHDGAMYEAALTARKLLDRKMNDLLTLIHVVYPMKQGPTETLIDSSGVEREVDPGQVEEFLASGWRRK